MLNLNDEVESLRTFNKGNVDAVGTDCAYIIWKCNDGVLQQQYKTERWARNSDEQGILRVTRRANLQIT